METPLAQRKRTSAKDKPASRVEFTADIVVHKSSRTCRRAEETFSRTTRTIVRVGSDAQAVNNSNKKRFSRPSAPPPGRRCAAQK